MRKLLSANLARLWKASIFRLCILFMAGIAVFILLNQYFTAMEYGYSKQLDNFILGYSLLIGIVAAVFSSLFLGTEYSDGVIRNKLIVGHGRISIYLSMLLTNIIAAMVMCLTFLIVICAIGIPLIGTLSISPLAFTAMLLGSLVMVCAVCAILTTISMLVPNKAVAAIICILGMVFLMIEAMDIQQKLDAPEFYPAAAVLVDGEFSMSEEYPNPSYLSGETRKLYELVYDILPTGQAFQYASMEARNLWQMPLYSLGIVIVSTFVGTFFFRRKDIK